MAEHQPPSQITTMASSPPHLSSTSITTTSPPPPSSSITTSTSPQQTQLSSPPPSSITTIISTQETHSSSPQTLQTHSQPQTQSHLSSTSAPFLTPPPTASTEIQPSSLTPPPSSTLTPQPSSDDPSASASQQVILENQPTQPQVLIVEQQQQLQHQNLIQNQQLQNQNWKQRVKPFAIVILLQILFAIMNILTKLAMNNGMSNFVFVSYRNIIAFLVISPFAIYHERDRWPEMTFSVFMKILALNVLGPIMDQDLYFLGMKYSTATLATALSNTLPGMTFVLAYITGRENVDITSKPSQAKILGTIITALGATVMTLVKGPILFGTVEANTHIHHHDGFHTILGVVFILSSTLSSAFSNILQTSTLSELNLPWSVFELDIKLLAAIYAGIFCSGLGFYLRGQVMQARGPVFGTMFSPVCMILVATSSYVFLDEEQLLGRVIGALIICLGLYCVVWGINKDNNLRRQENANAVANP
ncbi:hypothetical protein P8452_02794 [Trifolium repens]|nr:hypothetical protein P8452_02794 [Trifolium repens]